MSTHLMSIHSDIRWMRLVWDNFRVKLVNIPACVFYTSLIEVHDTYLLSHSLQVLNFNSSTNVSFRNGACMKDQWHSVKHVRVKETHDSEKATMPYNYSVLLSLHLALNGKIYEMYQNTWAFCQRAFWNYHLTILLYIACSPFRPGQYNIPIYSLCLDLVIFL